MPIYHDDGLDTDEDYVIIHPEVDYPKLRESVLNIQEQASKIKGIIRACKRLAFDEPDVHDRKSPLNPIRHALDVALIEMAALVRKTEQLVRETEPRFNFPKRENDHLFPSMGEIAAKLSENLSRKDLEGLAEIERGFDLEAYFSAPPRATQLVEATRPVTHFHQSKKKH